MLGLQLHGLAMCAEKRPALGLKRPQLSVGPHTPVASAVPARGKLMLTISVMTPFSSGPAILRGAGKGVG